MLTTKLHSVREESQPKINKKQPEDNPSDSISCVESLIDERLESPLH